MSAPPGSLLVVAGSVVPGDAPSAAAFLESTPGAYTTASTAGGGAALLWWPRHLRRLAASACLLALSRPDLLGLPQTLTLTLDQTLASIEPLVNRSMRAGIVEMRRRRAVEGAAELAVTALVRGGEEAEGLELCVHIGLYVPPVFGAAGARLAVAGRGREVAAAKYSQWARMRKGMERMRPPGMTELLLTNDRDRILEGSVTNFFVVCRKMVNETDEPSSGQTITDKFEVQTAPISDGVLPGVIRQLVIEVCSDIGIPLREVSPSWSDREVWEEAFVTSSLRLIQHVETIQAPSLWEEIELKTWEDVSWVVKQFEGPGCITAQIQREISRAIADGYDIKDLL